MVSSTPVFYDGRSTDGRTPVFNQTNLQVQQDVRLPGSEKRFQVTLNVLNLFDQDETLDVFRNYTRDNVPISDAAFFAGFDIDQVLAANPARPQGPALPAAEYVPDGTGDSYRRQLPVLTSRPAGFLRQPRGRHARGAFLCGARTPAD